MTSLPSTKDPKNMSDEKTKAGDLYLIRKGAYYYRPDACGYTADKNEAGRYTLEDAIRHSYPNGPDGPRDGIRYEVAPPVCAAVEALTPTPSVDEVEEATFLRDLADRLCKTPCLHHDGYDIDRLRELAAALQSRPAEPATDPCRLPAEPAGDDPVAWMYRDPAKDCAFHDGEDFATAKRWPAGVVEAQGWTETPLYARPATPTNPERLVELTRTYFAAKDVLDARVNGHANYGYLGSAASLIDAERELRSALSAAPLEEGEEE